jgi:hypothetical protein
MKLQLLRDNQDPVLGYKQIIVKTNNIDLSSVVDNECETILAPDILDSFQSDATRDVIEGLISKMRIGSELSIGGTDVRLFASAVTSGILTTVEASNFVTNSHSMGSWRETKEILKDVGLTIKSVALDGVHYEIKATREN